MLASEQERVLSILIVHEPTAFFRPKPGEPSINYIKPWLRFALSNVSRSPHGRFSFRPNAINNFGMVGVRGRSSKLRGRSSNLIIIHGPLMQLRLSQTVMAYHFIKPCNQVMMGEYGATYAIINRRLVSFRRGNASGHVGNCIRTFSRYLEYFIGPKSV